MLFGSRVLGLLLSSRCEAALFSGWRRVKRCQLNRTSVFPAVFPAVVVGDSCLGLSCRLTRIVPA